MESCDEPPFISEEMISLIQDIRYGPHHHTEAELRDMWSRIWKGFRSRHLCKNFMMHNRRFPIHVWRSAFRNVWLRKERINNINYVIRVASAFLVNGTPEERSQF